MTKNPELVRGLGRLALIASVFNCTVGGGIFKLPGSVYTIVGSAAPLVYLLCFVVIILVVTVFVQVGSHATRTGGPYAYVEPVLGPYVGFLSGILLWCLAAFAMASVANAYASFVGAIIPELQSTSGHALSLGLTFVLLAYFNIKGVKTGSRVSMILSVAKLLPLLLLVLVGLPHLNSTELALPSPMPWSSLSRGAMVLIFAFTGIESALIPSGEIENPEKNLPKALYSAVFLVLFLYLGVQFVSQSVLGQGLAGDFSSVGSPLAMTAERLMGPSGKWILMVGATLSTLGYLSALTLALPRSLYAFAVDGYLPKKLAEVHADFRTPVWAIIVQVIITWALAVSSQFEKLAVLANLSCILMYCICAVAAIKLHASANKMKVLAPFGALMAMAVLLSSVTGAEWMSVAALLALASVGYGLKNRSIS